MENAETSFEYPQMKIGKSVILSEGILTLEPNSITVIIGPNGCGKSSFLLDMAGLRPDYVAGSSARWSKNWDQIGWVCQDYSNSIFPWLGVEGNLKFYTKTPSLHAKELVKFDTNSFRKLSGGMKQRLSIAKEIGINKNGLLLLDEPFSAQHPTARLLVLEALKGFMKDGGSVVVITHEYDILSLPNVTTYHFKLLEKDDSLPIYNLVKYEKS